MSESCTMKSCCRLCGSRDLELVVPIGNAPVSEKYHTKENLSEQSIVAPLDLYFCNSCTHVQILSIIDPKFLWSDFTFQTAHNPVLVKHFHDYVSRVTAIVNINADDLILDVGSNDGTLLKCFQEAGYNRVLGVDPADEIVAAANKNGIPTIEGYMNDKMADQILSTKGKAKVVTANNVYAHVDDLIDMTQAIKSVLTEDGIFVFEVSYLLDVVEKNLIGTIFHEHLSYHSVTALVPFLQSQGLELFHVERGPEQGGSIIGYAQLIGGSLSMNESVDELLELERSKQLDTTVAIKAMYSRLETMKNGLIELTNKIIDQGKTISGFGAARAGTTLLSYFGVGDKLSHLFDDNASKHNKFSPGDKLEVLPTSEIYNKKPDYLLILAWIHADKIIASHDKFLVEGGQFIRLFPLLETVAKKEIKAEV